MIVPPFFGLYLPYKEREIYGLKHSYLANDVLTYSVPTNVATLTYLATDVFTYPIVDNPVTITWVVEDILTYAAPTQQTIITQCAIDVLCYEPPPEVPFSPPAVTALDGDSLAYLAWSEPYNNRSPLIDYTLQYRPYTNDNSNSWIIVSDGINLNTSYILDGLNNNIMYEFRVAAINAVGTGSYGLSNIIVPSGGNDAHCSLRFLIQPDAIDIASISDLSCGECTINHIGISSDDNYSQFGGRSLLFDGQSDIANNSNQFPYFTTAHHFKAVRNTGLSPQDYWSLNNDFTIELWLRPSSTATYNQTVMSVYSQEDLYWGNSSFWKIYLDTNNRLYFNVNIDYYDNETFDWFDDNLTVSTNYILPTGSFTHFAICRSNGYLTAYINGDSVYRNYFPQNIPLYTDFLIIGADHTNYNYQYDQFNIGRVYATSPFIGNIDDVLLSNTAKYRRNFIPSQYNNLGDCTECFVPGAVTNLTVAIVDGV